MDKVQIVKQVKEVIMKELFTDVDDKHCVLDLYIKNEAYDKQQLSKESQVFLYNKKSELTKEYGSGRILFFRKYNYEKILIQYLESQYKIDGIGLNLFSADKKEQELEEKKKLRLQEKQDRELEENILKQIPFFRWKKNVRISSVTYTSKDKNGKKLELHYIQGSNNKKTANKLIYNKQPFKYIKYDVKFVVDTIEKTHPKNVKADDSIGVVDKEQNKKKRKKNSVHNDDKIKQQFNTLNQQIYMGNIQKISNNYKVDVVSVNKVTGQIQTKCSYHKNGYCLYLKQKCTPYEKKCIHYYRFISKILEKSKQQNIVKRQTIKKEEWKHKDDKVKQQKAIHEIGLKDFVVRGNVFRCMHYKHEITNIDAMINIDNDGKSQQIKISAGYCFQCKVYFILDSVYENLKKKGMILCRVTDEKNYLKGGSANGMKLAQESLLMQYGYNVSQIEGLTATGRQKILAVIIDNKIMAKSEIISYLDFFISQRSSIPKMEAAISKWETDREFVENYRIGQYTQFGVNAIYRR